MEIFWIDFSEKKPDKSGHYLVTIENTRHKSVIFDSRSFVEVLFFLAECDEPHFEWFEDPDCEEVIAWAYLPEPFVKE